VIVSPRAPRFGRPAMEYRFLAPEEFELTRPSMEENGGEVPDPSQSAIAAAFDGDRLVGYAVLQLIPHLEPVYIAPEARGKVDWRRFQTMLEGLFEASGMYLTTTDNPRVAKMCERAGMEELPYRVFTKAV